MQVHNFNWTLVNRLMPMHNILPHNNKIDFHRNDRTHPNDFSGTSFCSKHAQNSSATADVEYNLVFKQMPVVVHRVAIGQRSNFIFQHLLQRATQTEFTHISTTQYLHCTAYKRSVKLAESEAWALSSHWWHMQQQRFLRSCLKKWLMMRCRWLKQ